MNVSINISFGQLHALEDLLYLSRDDYDHLMERMMDDYKTFSDFEKEKLRTFNIRATLGMESFSKKEIIVAL